MDIKQIIDVVAQGDIGVLPTYLGKGKFNHHFTSLFFLKGVKLSLYEDGSVCWEQSCVLQAQDNETNPLLYFPKLFNDMGVEPRQQYTLTLYCNAVLVRTSLESMNQRSVPDVVAIHALLYDILFPCWHGIYTSQVETSQLKNLRHG